MGIEKIEKTEEHKKLIEKLSIVKWCLCLSRTPEGLAILNKIADKMQDKSNAYFKLYEEKEK